MSNKLTKTKELVETIMELTKDVKLDDMSFQKLFTRILKKIGIDSESMFVPMSTFTSDGKKSAILCYNIFEDKTHYYNLEFEFENIYRNMYYLIKYELDNTLKTLEED